jgi:hypothetical protein
MKVRKGGIFTTIESKDFGIYQKAGFVKVVDEPLPKPEKVEPIKEVAPIVEEEPIKEVVQEEPIIEEEPEIVVPKRKRKQS